ncbi:MAG: hypothetical protein ABI592_08385 [Acidobacteriota bacterium]
MPFKSQAQRRKFAELLVKGGISPQIFEEWNRETGSAELPERVKPGPKSVAKRKPRAKSAARSGRKPAPKTKASRASTGRRKK